jgi:predicted enzyme related to lactoylglutathione lyase
MPEKTSHAPGSFCWAELGTTDSSAAKPFYAGLFGWEIEDKPMGPDFPYTFLKWDGKEIGALYQLTAEQLQMGVPPHWLLYIACADADATAAKATALGGTVLMGPGDVPEAGRFAIIKDPQGAVFGIWQAIQHVGLLVRGEDNTLTWTELATSDRVKAREFYCGLFGYGLKISQMGPVEYTEFQVDGGSIGGMLEMNEEWPPGIPPHWMAYYQVADCDASAAKATELGAAIRVPPTDIPTVGRFAVIADPQGAAFSIIKLTGMGM